MEDQELRSRINRLYWDSDDSVASIADRVGISRRALYEAIDPLPADRACPQCGGDLGFRNRTSVQDREAECPACGYTMIVPETAAGSRESQAAPAPAEPVTEAASPPAPDFDEPELEQEEDAGRIAPVRSPLARTVTGPELGVTILAGIAAGAVAGWLFRRR